MNLKKSFALAALVVAFSLNQSKANSYVYNFVETDGGSGVTGTITLDSAASSAGSLADVLGISFNDANAGYSFTFDPISEVLNLDPVAFTWTSTAITSMSIGISGIGNYYYSDAIYDNGLWYGGLDDQIYGNWVAANSSTVPDTANTFVLGALALGALVLWSRTMKIRPALIGKQSSQFLSAGRVTVRFFYCFQWIAKDS